jgi:hypothetical protein
MNRPVVGAAIAAVVMSLSASAAFAQSQGLKPSKTAHKPAAAKVEAADTNQSINQAQLDIASRVLVGNAKCEFNQQVSVQPLEGKPGFFKVGFKNAHYIMTPEATTTGAVRLEDKKAGVVWVQIPAKSMLLNSKIGQRMVDGCQQAEQRAS